MKKKQKQQNKTKAKKVKAKKVKKAPKKKIPKKAEDQNKKAAKLVHRGKERGFVTYDEILKEFPTVEDDVTFLDHLYEKLQQAGIDILDSGGMLDTPEEETGKKYKFAGREKAYDSIQMYLKEIGQYALVTAAREKELAR